MASVEAEEAPFNLALLLDLSGSAKHNRPAMIEAVRGFLNIARPQDKVAIYALANDQFQTVSHLTGKSCIAPEILNLIPPISGGSPIYDSLVLAYAEEMLSRPRERNAIIAITDGEDNQIEGAGTASEVSFKKLEKAANGMHALIFPIFLNAFAVDPSEVWESKAKDRLESLAQRTGGRVFPARQPDDLAPVYPKVAEALRSVYTISYSPKNQSLDGGYRGKVEMSSCWQSRNFRFSAK